MKRCIYVFLILVFILSLSACSCKIDWSNFDLTKRNFGLVSESEEVSSSTDVVTDTPQSNDDVVYSDEILNYTVPENESIVYGSWAVVSPEEFRSMAQEKLLEIARLNADLSGMKDDLSAYSTVIRITSDESFSKTLNNIRAWSYGAANYPSEGLSADDLKILEALVTIGTDSSEFGARLPSLIITKNNDTIGTYENLILSQIVALDSEINSSNSK